MLYHVALCYHNVVLFYVALFMSFVFCCIDWLIDLFIEPPQSEEIKTIKVYMDIPKVHKSKC